MAGAYKNSSFTGIDIVANFPQTVSKESIWFNSWIEKILCGN
jgi:hypothetical protein